MLLDIEGTTTPIAFVYDVLFPYAAERLDTACARAESDPEVAAAVEQLRAEHATDGGEEDFGNGALFARRLMQLDRKSTGLKALQGLIWREGYRRGTLRSQVFPDVPVALRSWHRAGVGVRIFSSGSVLAQQLLFSHTEDGDLTGLLEGYHDTTSGSKKAASSYLGIAETWGVPPGRVLFLSDVAEELNAAAEAGLHTGLVVREGNPPTASARHPRYRDFGTLSPLGDSGPLGPAPERP